MGVRVHSKDYVLRTRCVVESAKNFLSAAQDWGAGAIKIGEHCIKCRTLNCSNCGFSLNSWYSLGFYILLLRPLGGSPDPESVGRGAWSPVVVSLLWSPLVVSRIPKP